MASRKPPLLGVATTTANDAHRNDPRAAEDAANPAILTRSNPCNPCFSIPLASYARQR